ncbi:protein kinase [Actinomadura namibiensis]|uniref:Putative Ser/Thr protein kinase n=1 Tax=Actinomadura namibiensis TaxID=182080 RepID=A0A7W3LJI9_ACTNM|nr:serine/threonine-protein kinase [Actinomadura namibiensis]MBA8949327.1 putative Ser/Thr protein kinase [Actinomadura namibiensis]
MTAVRPLLPHDPARLGGYELVGRLGEGGQSIVYLGRGEDGRTAAVKLLRVQLSQDPQWRARFERELDVLGRVAGFCTAQVLAADVAGDLPYVVSEYVPGPSLTGLVTERGPRVGTDLDRLAIGTVTALAAIHRAGILHRDFKPSNVLMGPDGPRVIDFGIARVMGAARSTTSGIVGTPSYMAPEQISGEDLGTAVDLFAWGATMLFAATGRHPFGNDTISAVFHRILHHEPDLSPLPEALREVVAASLDKDPAGRPEAQQALLDLLGRRAPAPAVPPERALDTGAFLAEPPTDETPTERIAARADEERTPRLEPPVPPAARPRPGRRRVIAAGIPVMLLAAGGTVWALADDRSSPVRRGTPSAAVADTPAPPGHAVTAAATAAGTIEAVLTFEHDRFDRNVAAAHARVTPRYRADYDARLTAENFRENLRATRSAVAVDVTDTAVTAAGPGGVTVLAHLRRTVRSAGRAPETRRYTMQATLVARGAAWLLDGLYEVRADAVPASAGTGAWPGAAARAALAAAARDGAAASGAVVARGLRPGDAPGELTALLAVGDCRPGACRATARVTVRRIALRRDGTGWRVAGSRRP